MNLGLGNLAELKAQLLPAGLVKGVAFDDLIVAVGRGIASHFDDICNRRLGRLAGDVTVFSANRDHYYLPRYPVETITKVELRDSIVTGFVQQTGLTWNINESSGLIVFAGQLGPWTSNLRITYTGGYWFDETEDSSGVLPNGATLLPYDLKLAWFTQCRAVWESMDKTGAKLAQGSGPGTVTANIRDLKLVTQVEEILKGFIRFQIT